jgi:hypothetical protein
MLSSKALLRAVSIAALPTCAALAFVACSNGAPFGPTPTGSGANRAGRASGAVLSIAPDAGLSGETFTARDVTIKHRTCRGGVFARVDTVFRAQGTASGPYPGTFVATGRWTWGRRIGFPPLWGFRESFSITSRTRTSSGHIHGNGAILSRTIITCSSIGPLTGANFKYTSASWSGPVTGHINRRSLRERLQ